MRASSAMEMHCNAERDGNDWYWNQDRARFMPRTGDTTLYLRLAWRLQAAGVEVTLASASLASVREYLPGLVIVGEQVPDVRALAEQNDLVICAVDWLVNVVRTDIDLTSLPNVAFLAGKKLPVAHRLHERQVTLRGELVPGAHNVICRDPKAGKSMVEWMDLYAEEVLGLDLAQPLPGFASLPEPGSDAGRRVVIFPTTPHASKNYSTSGFRRLARLLVARGGMSSSQVSPSRKRRSRPSILVSS